MQLHFLEEFDDVLHVHEFVRRRKSALCITLGLYEPQFLHFTSSFFFRPGHI